MAYLKFHVMSGDTLAKLASFNNTTVANMMLFNPQLTDPNRISVGQQLVVVDTPESRRFVAARETTWNASIGAQQKPTGITIKGGDATNPAALPSVPSAWYSNPWILGGIGVVVIALLMGKKGRK